MIEEIRTETLELYDFASTRLATRLEGLTDEEYLWEPAGDCWTVHPAGDGTAHADWGLVFDEIPPVTTIAWRLSHIIDCLSSERCSRILEVEPQRPVLADGAPATAQAALAALKRAQDIWRGYMVAADPERLLAKQGPAAGIWAETTRFAFVLHIIDEFIHHGAEVALLRDLYRAQRTDDHFVNSLLKANIDEIDAMRRTDDAIVETTKKKHPDLMLRAAATGRWNAIPLLAELGFSFSGSNGRTPLHHAAADNNIDLIRFLVELGADLEARDPVYHSTPLVWAEYFQRPEAVAYLRSLTSSRVE